MLYIFSQKMGDVSQITVLRYGVALVNEMWIENSGI